MDEKRNNKNKQGGKPPKPSKAELSGEERDFAHKAVARIVDEYGEALRMLGRE